MHTQKSILQLNGLLLTLGLTACASSSQVPDKASSPAPIGPPEQVEAIVRAPSDATERRIPVITKERAPTVVATVRQPSAPYRAYRHTGKVNWYNLVDHGKKTTSGEIYDLYKLTAAHASLPIPSYVKVSYGKKSIIVRVNDRLPKQTSQEIKLAYHAAQKLGVTKKRQPKVVVQRLARP